MLAPSIRDCLEGGLLGPMLKSLSGVGCGDKTQYLPFVEEEGSSRVREMKHLFLIAFLDANTACPLVRCASWGWETWLTVLPWAGAYRSDVITQHSTPKISPELTLKLPPIHRNMNSTNFFPMLPFAESSPFYPSKIYLHIFCLRST